MNRYTKSFALTLFVYVIIFITSIYSFDTKKQIQSNQTISEQLVRFTIIQEAATKPEVKKIEKIVKKVIPKKTVKKIIKPIKKKKQKVVKKEKPKKAIKTKDTVTKKLIKKNKSVNKNTKSHLDEIKRNKINQQKYYTIIKEAINKNKSYPKMAVKRGIEGIVKIEFTISKDGELVSFTIIEGKKVFKNSIAEAVKNSFPIKPPKGVLSSNTQLSLMVKYRLY
jgi:protein TonB